MARITKIEATRTSLKRKIRVAAYARVSTDSDEQLLSLETQKAHYEEYIKSCPDYEFVDSTMMRASAAPRSPSVTSCRGF